MNLYAARGAGVPLAMQMTVYVHRPLVAPEELASDPEKPQREHALGMFRLGKTSARFSVCIVDRSHPKMRTPRGSSRQWASSV